MRTYQPGQVREAATPGVQQGQQLTAEAFGAGQARDLGKVGSALAQAGTSIAQTEMKKDYEAKKKISQANVMNKLYEARNASRQFMDGIYSKQGADAKNVLAETEEYFRTNETEFSKDLDEDEKQQFKRAYLSVASGHLDRTISHQREQANVYDMQTREAINADLVEEAIQYRADKDGKAIANAEANMLGNAKEIAKLKGMPEGSPAYKKYMEDTTHNLHTKVIGALKGDSMQAALGYLKENKDKFNPVVRDTLLKELDQKAMMERAQGTAKELMGSGANLEYVEKQLNKIKDPEEQKLARTNFRDMQEEKERLSALKDKQIYEAEIDKVYQDPKSYDLSSPEFMDLPADKMNSIASVRRMALRDEYAKQGVGRKVTSNLNAYAKIRQLPQDQKLDAAIEANKKGMLSHSHAMAFVKEATDEDKHKKTLGVTSYVNSMIADASLDEDQSDQLRVAFETEINKLPEEERDKVENYVKVKNHLFTEMASGSIFVPDDFLFERYDERSDIRPDSPPEIKGVPKNASWATESIGGQDRQGWVYSNDKGDSIFYDNITGKKFRVESQGVANNVKQFNTVSYNQ